MRKYQPIWERIKAQRNCTITAAIVLQPRIIRGVIKEKFEDIEFKVEKQLDNSKYRLDIKVNGRTITFTLISELSSIGI